MKIGDKVRFLDAVGGGTVSGFQDKDIVIVRDADGFDIPMLRRECVVIETDDYNIARTPKPAGKSEGNGPAKTQAASAPAAIPDEPDDDRPVTFRPKPLERRGGEKLNLYLAFVPVNRLDFSNTAFEAYLVNDSNYHVRFALSCPEGAAAGLWHEDEVEPNTKLFLEEFRRDMLPGMERMAFQAFAFKRDKTYLPKPVFDVALRPDVTKFYKLHSFTQTDFFGQPALLIDLIRDDRPARGVTIDAGALAQAMTEHAQEARPVRQPARKAEKDDPSKPLEVDLHVAELLETTAGLQPRDILEHQLTVFRRTMDEHLREKGRRIVFIHGKGEGVLRNALIKELKARYKQCRYQDASFREYGFGATMVTIG